MFAEFGEDGFRMLSLDVGDILHISKEEEVDTMRHVQSPNHILNTQTGVEVLVSMATDMEIPRYFLYSEISSQLTSVSILEC